MHFDLNFDGWRRQYRLSSSTLNEIENKKSMRKVICVYLTGFNNPIGLSNNDMIIIVKSFNE